MSVNPQVKLVDNILDLKSLTQEPIRKGYGLGLLQAGDENPNVVALCADLTDSTMTSTFSKKYPERFVEMGVAEQNMASVAAGMALMGKVPYIASYAMFSPGRNWEQIRTTICHNEANVKIAGAHAGVSVGPDGATHQAIEDMAIMRPIANMKVFAPCDSIEAQKITYAVSKFYGPAYIRYARDKTPVFTTAETPFEVGRAQIFWLPAKKKVDAAIIACGLLVHNAILAAGDLEKEGLSIKVINNPSVKPMDEDTIIKAARETKAVATAGEHQVVGGMRSAVAGVLAKNYPVAIEFIGVHNRSG